MSLQLKKPLAFFDLETTGTNVPQDRIVEIAIAKVMPDESIDRYLKRLNPTIPISEESTRVHGITDADVKNAPTFKECAKEIQDFLDGADLAGFNILKFDLPMIVEEFLRADIEFDISKRKLIDAQKIFHLMEKRTLAAAYKFYCGQELKDAHSAMADTDATLEVFKVQMQQYEGQPLSDLRGTPMGTITKDIDALHDALNQDMIDLAGRMVYHEGEPVFNFGKHRMKPVKEILQKEPSYYDWIINNDFPLDTKKKLAEIRLSMLNTRG